MTSLTHRVKTFCPLVLVALAWTMPVIGMRIVLGVGGLRLHFVLLLTLLIAALLPFVPRTAVPRCSILFGLVFGSLNAALVALHTFILFTYLTFGIVPSADELYIARAQASSTLALFGLAPKDLLVAFVLVWVGLVFLYYRASRPLLATLSSLDSCLRVGTPAMASRLTLRAVASVILLCAGAGYLSTYRLWRRSEPIHRLASTDRSHANMVPDGILQTLGQRAHLRAADGPHTSAPRPRNLILITVDALRSDQMSVYGSPFNDTPFLTSLVQAGELRRIDNAYSTCTLSFCGILGIQASSYWHQLPSASRPLADVLEHYDYRTHFLLAGDHSHFYGLQHFYASNPTEFRDGSSLPHAQIDDDHAILPWIQAVRWPKDQPTFLAIHLMSVHFAGLRHPEFARWQPSVIAPEELLAGASVAQLYANHYRNGILQADDMIRQIFGILAARSVLRDAFILITADHGESIGENGIYLHGHEPREPEVRIPLLIYDHPEAHLDAPALYTARPLTSQIDIAPTFLYAIGAPIPPAWFGIPLQLPTTRQFIDLGTHDTNGIVAQTAIGRFKYYQLVAAHEERLYDLDTDPLETSNLARLTSAAPILNNMRAFYRQSGQP